ncbi:MAG: hypothetical protein NXI31_17040 [bacterium]|nr:hypothetical protein [bacterium]
MQLDAARADEFVDTLVRDWRTAALEPAERALCEFAVQVTRDSGAMTAASLEPLRLAGFSDPAIHDATQVVGYFNYINRIADALGVEPEDFVRAWGELREER